MSNTNKHFNSIFYKPQNAMTKMVSITTVKHTVMTKGKSLDGISLPSFDKHIGVRLDDDGSYLYKPEIILNTITSVNDCMNKKLMKETLAINEAPVPPLIFFPKEKELPVIYRQKNETPVIIRTMSELRQCVNGVGFYEKIVDASIEYRIHVIDGRVFIVDIKQPKADVKCNTIRTTTNGYKFVNAKQEPPKPVIVAALHAMWAMGLDLGAVDVGYKTPPNGSNGRGAVVYGVTVNIGMRKSTKDKYAEAITKYALEHGAKIM